jgi:hypothetical protein
VINFVVCMSRKKYTNISLETKMPRRDKNRKVSENFDDFNYKFELFHERCSFIYYTFLQSSGLSLVPEIRSACYLKKVEFGIN